MNQPRRIITCLAVLFLIIAAMSGTRDIVRPSHRVRAQFGATTVPGYFAGATPFVNPVVTAGQAGGVTNPAVNFVVQVGGGPVYCNGNQSSIAESNVTLSASRTFLIVYNCPQETTYAKVAVVGPGTLSPDQPGVPATILAPVFGVEVPLATVVCSATACGNGSGSITDSRPIGSFPSGTIQAGSVLFANLPATFPNGGMLYCSNCTLASSPCTGASTGAMALRVNGAWRCQ